MSKPFNVYIHPDLHNSLIKLRKSLGSRSKLFLLGMTKEGLIKYKIKLRCDYYYTGCQFMPGLTPTSIAKGVSHVNERGFIVAGFGKITPYREEKYLSSAIRHLGEGCLLNYTPHRVEVIRKGEYLGNLKITEKVPKNGIPFFKMRKEVKYGRKNNSQVRPTRRALKAVERRSRNNA